MNSDLNVKNLCENNESCQEETEKNKEEEEELKIFTYHFKNCLSNKDISNEEKIKIPKKRTLPIADSVISSLIIGPLVIGHWRGVWNLMDLYELPFSGLVCFLIGTGLHLIFVLSRELLHYYFAVIWRNSNPIGRAGYHFVRLLYTYIFSVTCNMQWRGGWIVLSSVMGENEWTVSVVTIFLLSVLLILRSSRNLLAPPLIVIADLPSSIFKFPTRYRKNTRDWTLYALDCLFSVGIVGTLVVFVWRGIWVLLDLHLFPDNREYSSICSLIIGYVIVAITFCLQPVMRYACSRIQGLPRLLAADAFLLLSFIGTVNVWRGVWSMLDLWFIPEDPELSCWITHVGCFVFLGLLNCSNSILVRGVYIDARDYTENNGKDLESGALLNCTTLPTVIPSSQDHQG